MLSSKSYPVPMAGLPDYLAKGPVGREPLAREVVEEHQRRRIAEAAVAVFAEHGYRAATIDHLVAAAQIGVGSFYSLFEGKQECFLFVYGLIVEEAREHLAEAVPEGAGWAERASAGLRELLESIAAEPWRARIVFVEAHTAGPAAEARYAETMAELAGFLRGGRALRAGEPELPAGLESATVAGLAWLLQQRLLGAASEDVASLLPGAAQIVFEPYLGAEESAALVVGLVPAAAA
jgi:AcrR family transcriptional regulator